MITIVMMMIIVKAMRMMSEMKIIAMTMMSR